MIINDLNHHFTKGQCIIFYSEELDVLSQHLYSYAYMKMQVQEGIIIIIAFIAMLYLYAFITYFGIEEFLQEGVLKDYFSSNLWHIEVVMTGTLFGILFIFINRLTERPSLQKRSFGYNILIKSTLYLIALVAVSFLVFSFFISFGLVSADQMREFRVFTSPNFLLAGLLYYSLFIILFNFVLLVKKKFGPGVLLDLLTGKYDHPRNEPLIFLFIDLKNSTGLAEKMGNQKYSSFIKDCVHQLTPFIQKYQAHVYQYVGDEIVLFWDINTDNAVEKCFLTFFEFKEALSMQSSYFEEKYGAIPHFKAGMDSGLVTVTEIGDIKREIAYHGDVLNTASRLEKKCNEYQADLITSENILEIFRREVSFRFEFLSKIPLRGKRKELAFYRVVQNQKSIRSS